ncbi:MAG TPA: hypothetical protein PK198_11435 [Saprospiraceae bacterium]|nr:hypothetical protein [Saprospiraceae bacterium]
MKQKKAIMVQVILDSQWFANFSFCKPLAISYPDEKWFIFFRKPFFIGYKYYADVNPPHTVRWNFAQA